MASPVAQLLLLATLAALIQPVFLQVKRAPRFLENLQDRLQTQGVMENTPIGDKLGTLRCTDEDGNDSDIRYSANSQTVSVNATTGDVFMGRVLDRENTPDNQDDKAKILRVSFFCTDLDNLRAGFAVDITVLDENDNPPVFANRPYATFLPENATVGTTVMRDIRVQDADTSANARVQISCRAVLVNQSQGASEDACLYFRVDSQQTGLGTYLVTVVLQRTVDFEARRDFSVPLFAIDEGTPSLNSTESVLISISDQQDTDPLFLNTPITLYVSEGSQIGESLATQLSAQDGDRGEPRPLNISILEDRDNLFRIGSSVKDTNLVGTEFYRAPLFVNAPIDREKYTGTYSFTAKVTELQNGQPTPATATTLVRVSVSDINDNVPTFSNPSYTVSLAESDNSLASNDLQIPDLNIQVTDEDDASNAVYFVRIRSQSYPTFRVFPVNITGNAILNLLVANVSYLDYDTPSFRRQTVVLEAVEGTQTSSTTVTVNLQDVNDNSPQFVSSGSNITLREDTPVNTRIFSVTATDRDSGDNGRVTYSLQNSNSDIFRVNNVTGEVTLVRQLDYETTTGYTLLVEASDNGNPQRVERRTFFVNVQNINDNPPSFSQSYVTYAFENSRNLTPAVRVEATDPEQPQGGFIYRIEGENPQNSFRVNPNTGELTLINNLDYDNTPNRNGRFLVRIIAIDNGNPPLTGTTTVTINVQDQNNKRPEFVVGNIYRNISELSPPGMVLTTLTATDGDIGTNGEVRYQIATGSLDHFTINAETGQISVSSNARFDYDEFRNYNMIVYAIDRGSPPQTGTATVSVDLLDANNKNPSFAQAIYTRSIPESTPIGTSILNLQAQDPDTSSRLVYQISIDSIIARNNGGGVITSLTPFDYQNAFRINDASGVITTASALRRDYAAKISFQVVVRDMGADATPQSATTSVLITILGTNVSTITFNPPWTEARPEYRMSLTETRVGGFFITTVGARDPTCGNCLLQNYVEVPQSDPNGYFSVERTTGRVRVDKPIDFDTLTSKTLSVEVDAIASDGRSARTTIFVEVSDDNDNNPVFVQDDYRFTVSESARYPSVVGYVSATDADSGSFGMVSFSLSGQNSSDFGIDSRNNRGMIYIGRGKELDFETRRVYSLLVLATDNPFGGTSQLQLQTSVSLVIEVLDVNDNAPVFNANGSYEFYAVESFSAGTKVGTVSASDKDTGSNGEVTYSVSSDTEARAFGLFQVDSVTGVVTTRAELRGESVYSPFTFVVRAEDRGSPQLMSTKLVRINVQSGQLDDGTPLWSQPSVGQIFVIPENSPLGTNVTQVQARARTVGASVTYRWLPSSDPDDRGKFGLDPITGLVYVTGDLDREQKETYSLIVSARDSTNASLESYRRVTIRLSDLPDNVPSFSDCPDKRLPRPVRVQLTENVPVGTSVYTVEACDPDAPPNNQMLYYPVTDVAACDGTTAGHFTVNINGTIFTNTTMDRESKERYLVCVQVLEPENQGRRRRRRQVDLSGLDNSGKIAYVEITLVDLNDNGPYFPNPVQSEILSTFPTSGTVVTVSATDPDAPPLNRVRYVRESTVLRRPSGNPVQANAAFIVNSDTGEVTTNYPTYADFAPGYFDVVIRAEDFLDSSKNTTMTLRIYMYTPTQSVRLVLNEPPKSGQTTATAVLRDLNSVDGNKVFRLEAVTAHRDGDDGRVNTEKTDVCFVYIESESKSVQSVVTAYSTIMDSSRYNEVLRTYGSPQTGACYASSTSRDNIQWQDLWWVLVAIGIFIFICCVILIIFISMRYDNYKYNMTRGRPYMVQS